VGLSWSGEERHIAAELRSFIELPPLLPSHASCKGHGISPGMMSNNPFSYTLTKQPNVSMEGTCFMKEMSSNSPLERLSDEDFSRYENLSVPTPLTKLVGWYQSGCIDFELDFRKTRYRDHILTILPVIAHNAPSGERS
jgi:hypothetical protein